MATPLHSPNSAVVNISAAVDFFLRALTDSDNASSFELLATADIAPFIETDNLPAFIHLLCHAALLHHTRHPHIHFDRVLERRLPQLRDTAWFIPACLAMLELRFTQNQLAQISALEIDALKEFYGLTRLQDPNHLQFYRSGTTSIIFVSGAHAVKIVRPVYLLDKEVASLDTYRDRYAGAPLSPVIAWATPTVLVMEWLRGPTLADYLSTPSALDNTAEKLSLIRALGSLVGQIHNADMPHGDLNPHNIIIADSGFTAPQLRLIDYGVNYSLTKPILSAQAYRDSIRYIAPSDDDSTRDPFLDDLYAASIIILDIWFGTSAMPPADMLHELSLVQPLLSSVLDDALIDNPQLRLRKLSPTCNDRRHLSRRFSSAIQLACSLDVQSTRPSDAHMSLFSVLLSNPTDVLLGYDDSYITIDNATSKKLKRFRAMSIAATAISASLIFSVATDSYFDTGSILTRLRELWAASGMSLTPRDARFWDIMPGLSISFSFLMLATKYYLAIFSTLAPDPQSGYGGFAAHFTMRLNAVAYAVPISYCFILDPNAWPFCAAAGLAVVALNNHCTFKFIQRVRNDRNFKELALSRSAEAQTSYIILASWPALVAWYALGILLAGVVMLTTESAHNALVDKFLSPSAHYNTFEYLIAASVIGINYFKMQRENCGRLAPKMRALVQRFIEAAKVLGR